MDFLKNLGFHLIFGFGGNILTREKPAIATQQKKEGRRSPPGKWRPFYLYFFFFLNGFFGGRAPPQNPPPKKFFEKRAAPQSIRKTIFYNFFSSFLVAHGPGGQT